MKYKTPWQTAESVDRKWYIVDAGDQVLGRLATKIAKLIIGKDKATFSPNVDGGDYVVVVNSSKVKLTRGKETKKFYYSHSGFPGGFKEIRFDKQLLKNPNFIIEEAVKNMLPKNKLQDARMGRLFVYADDAHKHEAQKPEVFKL